MATKPCKTPKCRGKAKGDFAFCWCCEKAVRAAMSADGYLQNLDDIKAEERRRVRNFLSEPGGDRKKKRAHGKLSPVGVAVTGNLLKSGKYKKTKEAA